MPTYVSLLNLTEQGLRDAKAIPGRIAAAREMFRSLNVEMEAVYMTTGAHDFVLVIKAPDDQTAAKAMLSLGMRGNVSTETSRAFLLDEIEAIAADLR